MGDIQQWRRKIQPARARTPATFDTEDSEDLPCPNTPKQRLKRKVSSYFDFGHGTKAPSAHEELSGSHLLAWPADQPYPDPKAEEEIDSAMCILMSAPHQPLDVRFNCSLMRIFEDYLRLRAERDLLQKRLNQEAAATQAVASKYNMAEKDWEDEKQDYKEEVKRLEVLLSKASKRGLAEVTLARQNSKIQQRKVNKGDQKETIFEFLEKAKRYDDRFYSSQRATMKPLLPSPSDRDKRMSQKLAGKKSMTNIHADLPFGTPPEMDSRFSLAKASILEQQTKRKGRPRAVTTSTTSDDTFSSFSYNGDVPFKEPTQAKRKEREVVTSTDKDFLEIERLANALARRRNVDPIHVMPQLLDIFGTQRANVGDRAGSMPTTLGSDALTPKPALSTRIVSENAVKRQTVMSKASGFFQRLRPQLSVDTPENSRGSSRRFSFEPGDDQTALSAATVPNGSKDQLLRKSVSLDALRQYIPVATAMEHTLSPVAASPTTSAFPTEPRPPTRIPTPSYSSGSLAKPRQKREDSASSLLTAIRNSEEAGKRCNSLSSSVYSSPSASREELNRLPQANPSDQGPLSGLRSNSSNRLSDHTNNLRCSSLVSAAAKTACAASEGGSDGRAQRKQTSTRSSQSMRSPGVNEFRQENKRPVDSPRS